MTNVTSKEAVVLAYLARHRDISESEWQELVNSLTGEARELAEKLKELKAKVEETKAKIAEAKAKLEEAQAKEEPRKIDEEKSSKPASRNLSSSPAPHKLKTTMVRTRATVQRQKVLTSA